MSSSVSHGVGGAFEYYRNRYFFCFYKQKKKFRFSVRSEELGSARSKPAAAFESSRQCQGEGGKVACGPEMGAFGTEIVNVRRGHHQDDPSELTINCPDKVGLGCDFARIVFEFGLKVVKGGKLFKTPSLRQNWILLLQDHCSLNEDTLGFLYLLRPLMLADVGTQSVLPLDISILRYGLFCIQASVLYLSFSDSYEETVVLG